MDRFSFIFWLACLFSPMVYGFGNLFNFTGMEYSHVLLTSMNNSEISPSNHVMLNPEFWRIFSYEVEVKKSWKCSFPADLLSNSLELDAKLYDHDSIEEKMFRKRRHGVKRWIENDTLWTTVVLGACKELALGQKGAYVKELEQYDLVDALQDYVDHIHYFYTVATLMDTRGERVVVFGQKTSPIHDIDKLDPVMLVGYSERFTDGKNTSAWNVCVERHTHSFPHHQQHCVWHNCCGLGSNAACDFAANVAIREMVCDKISRRLQKVMDGVICDAMWDADIRFYTGLPPSWLSKAVDLMHRMKHWKD